MTFADKVRNHILKENFLACLDQNTPPTNKGVIGKYPRSEMILKKSQEGGNKFVNPNNMQISAFHTSKVYTKQGPIEGIDHFFKKKELDSKKFSTPTIKEKEEDIIQKEEQITKEKDPKNQELGILKSIESIHKNPSSHLKIELGNLEKQLYQKMEKMQILHKERLNQVILEKNEIHDKFDQQSDKLKDTKKLLRFLKDTVVKEKRGIVKKVNVHGKQFIREFLNKVGEIKKEKINNLRISVNETFLYRREMVSYEIDTHEVYLKRKNNDKIFKSNYSQTISRIYEKTLDTQPRYQYANPKNKLELTISCCLNKLYSNEKKPLILPTKTEEKIKPVQMTTTKPNMILDKENEGVNTQNVKPISTILTKRNFENSSLNTNERYKNDKSIVNLSKKESKLLNPNNKTISEFPMYPVTRKKAKTKKTKRLTFENSVQIRNLVEVRKTSQGLK